MTASHDTRPHADLTAPLTPNAESPVERTADVYLKASVGPLPYEEQTQALQPPRPMAVTVPPSADQAVGLSATQVNGAPTGALEETAIQMTSNDEVQPALTNPNIEMAFELFREYYWYQCATLLYTECEELVDPFLLETMQSLSTDTLLSLATTLVAAEESLINDSKRSKQLITFITSNRAETLDNAVSLLEKGDLIVANDDGTFSTVQPTSEDCLSVLMAQASDIHVFYQNMVSTSNEKRYDHPVVETTTGPFKLSSKEIGNLKKNSTVPLSQNEGETSEPEYTLVYELVDGKGKTTKWLEHVPKSAAQVFLDQKLPQKEAEEQSVDHLLGGQLTTTVITGKVVACFPMGTKAESTFKSIQGDHTFSKDAANVLFELNRQIPSMAATNYPHHNWGEHSADIYLGSGNIVTSGEGQGFYKRDLVRTFFETLNSICATGFEVSGQVIRSQWMACYNDEPLVKEIKSTYGDKFISHRVPSHGPAHKAAPVFLETTSTSPAVKLLPNKTNDTSKDARFSATDITAWYSVAGYTDPRPVVDGKILLFSKQQQDLHIHLDIRSDELPRESAGYTVDKEGRIHLLD